MQQKYKHSTRQCYKCETQTLNEWEQEVCFFISALQCQLNILSYLLKKDETSLFVRLAFSTLRLASRKRLRRMPTATVFDLSISEHVKRAFARDIQYFCFMETQFPIK